MKHIGKSYPLHDAENKVTGRSIYAGDMELKGMLHMSVLYSTIPHGYVKKLNYQKALEIPGVVDVLYYGNTTQKEYNRYHTQYRQDLIETERIFNQHVRFVGDRIAAVVAETKEIANRAIGEIEIEYEEYPYSLDMFETLAGNIDNIHEKGAVFGDFEATLGEIPDEEFIEIETTTNLARVNHLCMETHACVAEYDKGAKMVTIYSPNQSVFGIRSFIADLFEMDYMNVRSVKTTMGGSFGAKQEWILEPLAAAAAMRVGRPVKIVYGRAETIRSTYSRAPMNFKSIFKFNDKGELRSINCDMTLDAGAYLGNSINYAITLGGKFFKAYRYPHYEYKTRVALTNTIVSGAFRGWTSTELAIMFEHNMNMAAKKMNIDPVDIRLKNVLRENEIEIKTGLSVGDFKGHQVLTQGRDSFNWDARKKEVEEFNSSNKRFKRGIGVGYGGHVNGFYPIKTDFSRVDMRLTESGSIQCNVTVHDHGCGSVTAFRMIVAEEMGININQVHVTEGDTQSTPFDVGCYSSRTIFVIGRAVQKCAMALKDKMKEHFCKHENCKVEDVIIEGMTIYSVKNQDIKYSWSDLVYKSIQFYQHEVFASYEYVNETNPGVSGAHFAYVEIDRYTGMTKFLDYLAVHDIGQAINREVCIAQTQSGAVMGIGAALSEHVVYKKNGTPKASMKDYHVINSYDAPDVRVEFIENGNTEGPYGAKTIGEIGLVPAAAAVVSAVNDALDSELNSVPLTPDDITAFIEKREREVR